MAYVELKLLQTSDVHVLQGIQIYVTVWDSDKYRRSDDMVDEFFYTFNKPAGSLGEILDIVSLRCQPKSRLDANYSNQSDFIISKHLK